MSINQLIKLVLALLAGLVGLMLLVSACGTSTGDESSLSTAVARTSIALTAAAHSAEFTPEIPFSSLSQALSATSTPLVTPTVSKTVLTTKALHVALRAGPHINHPGASKNFDKGTPMEVLGTHDDWYFVSAPDGAEGWLYKEWLNIDPADLTDIPIIMTIPTAPLNTRVPPPKPRQPDPQKTLPSPQEPLPSPYP